jgi:hypothetical protein
VHPPFEVTRLEALERIPLGDMEWRPIRRTLGVTAFGVNAYTGAEPGAPVIEPHDETSSGAGGHEELYLVITGHAAFIVGGEPVDAPAGTLVLVPPGVPREATARAAETTIVVVGGKPGAGLPVSPYEHWYAAEPAYAAGDYDEAIAIASQGLADAPDHPVIHYQLACYHALAGRPGEAVEALRVAVSGDPRTRQWASGDADLDSIRDHPDYPA